MNRTVKARKPFFCRLGIHHWSVPMNGSCLNCGLYEEYPPSR